MFQSIIIPNFKPQLLTIPKIMVLMLNFPQNLLSTCMASLYLIYRKIQILRNPVRSISLMF